MSFTFSSKIKSCAVCEYWDGPRKPGTFRHQVVCDSTDTLGYCCGPSSKRGTRVRAGSIACKDYLCWRFVEER